MPSSTRAQATAIRTAIAQACKHVSGAAVCVLLLLACGVLAVRPAIGESEPIIPLAESPAAHAAKAALGEALFRDRRLSRGNTFACASCHQLDHGGDDPRARPAGLDGRPLDFNSPSIFNAALNFRLNWRGNFRTFEMHNEAVLLDRRLMGTTWDEIGQKLRSDADFAKAFAGAYGTQPDRPTVLDALATFQRSLLTPNARFDRYLRGERDAITRDEERGYRLFKAYGCIACHQGANVGGNLFQKFGIFADPFAGQSQLSEGDLGRFTMTGRDIDRHVFRVPSLRNVAVTAPYFHDGRTSVLAEAVAIMGRNQLGRELPVDDVQLIATFLGTLTGEYRGRPLSKSSESRPP